MKNRNFEFTNDINEQNTLPRSPLESTSLSASSCSTSRAKTSSPGICSIALVAVSLLFLSACSLPDFFSSAESNRLGDGGYQGWLSGSGGDAMDRHARPKATPVVVPAAGSLAVGAFEYNTLNDQARFLAGMSGGRRSQLRGLRETAEWEKHRRSMDHLWNYFSGSRYGRIQAWRDSEMPDLVSPGVVFYPFSGPDFLFADAFFPGARQYILCGLEGTDSLPDPTSLTKAEITTGLNGVAGSLDTLLGASYFITKEMKVDLQATRFRGTLPLLMVFMARTEHSIVSVRGIDLSQAGEVVGRGAAGNKAPGWHIVCRSPQGQRKDVYYFREDLSNGTLASDRRLLSFVNSRGTPITFVKSASYLMHNQNFSIVRDQVLTRSLAVLQDPSGVPFRHYRNEQWDLALYGNYVRTLDIFRDNYQADLAAAYRQKAPHPVKPMEFGIGYQYDAATTSLILARSRRLAAEDRQPNAEALSASSALLLPGSFSWQAF